MSKPHPGELLLLPAFIWKTIRAASLKIRSQLAKAGARQGANCLNSRWVYAALCSDKRLLCSPEKSDLLKPSRLPLFSFTLALPPQTTEFGRLKNHFTCQLKCFPSSYQVVSFPTQGKKLLCYHSGDRKPLWEESGCAIFTAPLWSREQGVLVYPGEFREGCAPYMSVGCRMRGESCWLGLHRLVWAQVSVWQ